MTHEEFVARLGPILAPENYELPSTPISNQSVHTRRRSGSGPVYGSSTNGQLPVTVSPYAKYIAPGMPPFDWMHFEGRSLHVTHANITGIDGLARERGWRDKCVFSLQIGRLGVEMVSRLLLPYFSSLISYAVNA